MRCSNCNENFKEEMLVEFERCNPTLFLCKECRKECNVETENDIIEEIQKNILTPKQIVKELDKYIVGQDKAKKTISVEVYNHFLRIISKNKIKTEDRFIRKNNIMLTGLSGTGKTLLAETLARIVGVPFVIVNATSYSERGYSGQDVEAMLLSLLEKSKMNPNRAKFGIIFIDEVDKIARKNSSVRDVSGEGVQHSLLKLVEGTLADIPDRGGRIVPNQPGRKLDTTNILFLCGGAFSGIEEITKSRLNINSKSAIGFATSAVTHLKDVSADYLRSQISCEDLIEYGMITEFVGRFPVLCNLNPLTVSDLVEILKSDNGILEEYRTIFNLQDKNLEFTNDSLQYISDIAIKTNVGARGLRGIVSKFMNDILYEAPSENKECYVVGTDVVEQYFSN